MKVNFLRTIRVVSWVFIGTVLCGVALWCIVPTYRVDCFENAIAAGEFEDAAEMGVSCFRRFTPRELEGATVQRAPLTWQQVLRGEREFAVVLVRKADGVSQPLTIQRKATPFSISYGHC